MDEELDYLWETLGLEITADLWPERDKIHPTLRPAITVVQAKYRRASFLIMRMSWHAGLPDLKRIQASLVELSGMPTVISEAHLEQRQRERLQQQRIPSVSYTHLHLRPAIPTPTFAIGAKSLAQLIARRTLRPQSRIGNCQPIGKRCP